MKIFLCLESCKKSSRTGRILSVLLCILVVATIISQLCVHLAHRSMPVSTSDITPSVQSGITLTARCGYPTDDVVIYVNGEQAARFENGKAKLDIEQPSAIEVMCPDETDLTVTIAASDGITVLQDASEIVCKRGMNFICRCYRTQ